MIRDPSDGSVRHHPKPLENQVYVDEKPVLDTTTFGSVKLGVELSGLIDARAVNMSVSNSLLSTSTSGLPISARADDLARLEESRKWLENYVRPTING
jgi:hypothetical protein